MTDLQKLVDKEVQRATRAFNESGGLPLIFVGFDADDGAHGMVFPGGMDPSIRSSILKLVRMAWKARGIVRYVVTSEVWIASPDQETIKREGMRPAGEYADRGEAVMVIGVEAGRVITTTLEIDRSGPKPTLLEPKSLPGGFTSGDLITLLPDGNPTIQ